MNIQHVRPAKLVYQRLVNDITRMAGMNYTIEVWETDMINAVATMTRDGKPIIVYGKQLIDEMEARSTWAVIAIFAHEVAHHFNEDLYGKYMAQLQGTGYRIDMKSHKKELNADYFAGQVLRYKGAKLHQALELFKAIPGLFKESATHPAPVKRAQALRSGWVEAHNELEPWNRMDPSPPQAQHVSPNSGGGGWAGLLLLALGAVAVAAIANKD